MNKIKFRAWDTDRKTMSDSELLGKYDMTISADGLGFINVHPKEFSKSTPFKNLIPIQFTGLKDKKGKEIYEGDIVKWKDPEGVRVAIVSWNKGEIHYFDVITNKTFNQGSFIYSDTYKFLEIIGNKFENPELLK